MEVQRLIAQLPDPDARPRASDRLVRLGRASVRELVQALDVPSCGDLCAGVLRLIGPPAYRPLVRFVGEFLDGGGSEQAARRACDALGFPLDNGTASLVQHCCGRESRDRSDAAQLIGSLDDMTYVPLLVLLLVDPDENVRYSAIKALRRLGPRVIPELRQVRRSAIPERRGVLAALAEFGWSNIDPADITLLGRLLDLKLATERAEPIEAVGKCAWYALPTADQAAVLEAFDLSHPVQVTIRAGSDAVLFDKEGPLRYDDGDGDRQIFVTPMVDGWTLIFGDPVVSSESRTTFPPDILERLSNRFGAVHWYKVGDSYDSDHWYVVEQGKVVSKGYRSDSTSGWELDDPADPIVDGLRADTIDDWLSRNGFPSDLWEQYYWPLVQGLMASNCSEAEFDEAVAQRWSSLQEHTGIPDEITVTEVARRASVGPHLLGPQTRLAGHGVVALTTQGRDHGGFRGAVRI